MCERIEEQFEFMSRIADVFLFAIMQSKIRMLGCRQQFSF
jgi:hypothetical protein